MSEDLMLKCLIAFILGYLASRMMGNGFSVGGRVGECCSGWNRCSSGELCDSTRPGENGCDSICVANN